MIALLNAIVFWAFMTLLVAGAARTAWRAAAYRRAGIALPLILRRDLVSRTGLALAFGTILLARVLGISGLGDNIWWLVLTDVPALASVATYAYFEFFVIDRAEDDAFVDREHGPRRSDKTDS